MITVAPRRPKNNPLAAIIAAFILLSSCHPGHSFATEPSLPHFNQGRLVLTIYANEDDAPEWAKRHGIMISEALSFAGRVWSAICPVDLIVAGTTGKRPVTRWADDDYPDFLSKAGWATIDDRDINANTTSAYPSEFPGLIVQTDIAFDTVKPLSKTDFFALAVHEVGHAIGMEHNKNPLSSMSSSPYPTVDVLGNPGIFDSEKCHETVRRRLLWTIEWNALQKVEAPLSYIAGQHDSESVDE